MGVDPARFGTNNTSITGLEGMRHYYRKVYQGMDTAYTANYVMGIVREQNIRAVAVDCDGLGSGVKDKLVESREKSGLDFLILEVHNGGEAEEPDKFVNARSEDFWRAREAVVAQEVSVLDEGELLHQLSAIKYKFDSQGRIALETKDSMRRRGMESPDEADSFVLALRASRIVGARNSGGTASWLDNALSGGGGDMKTGGKQWR